MDEQKTKRKLNMRVVAIVIVVVLLGAYFAIDIFSKEHVDTDKIMIGVAEKSVNMDVLLARKEVVYKAGSSGVCVAEVPEGNYVGKGMRVASIGSNDKNTIAEKIRDVENKIADYYNEKLEKEFVSTKEIVSIENDLLAEIDRIIALSIEGNIDETRKNRDALDKLTTKLSNEKIKNYMDDPKIASLVSQKETLEKELTNSIVGINSTKGTGIVSYCLDGYESELVPNKLGALSEERFNSIFSNDTIVNYSGVPVSSGAECLKVCPDQDTYIVGMIPEQYKNDYSKGTTVSIRFKDINDMIKGTVTKIGKKDSGYMVVVKVSSFAYKLVSKRTDNVDMILASKEGMKVSRSSLVNIFSEEIENDKGEKETRVTANMYVIIGSYAKEKTVKVEWLESDWAIISNYYVTSKIYMDDVYIKNPDGIEDGQTVYD